LGQRGSCQEKERNSERKGVRRYFTKKRFEMKDLLERGGKKAHQSAGMKKNQSGNLKRILKFDSRRSLQHEGGGPNENRKRGGDREVISDEGRKEDEKTMIVASSNVRDSSQRRPVGKSGGG